MTTYIYPQPEWVDDSIALYDEKFEKKLEKLSGAFAFEINPHEEWGIMSDLYILLVIDAGKLKEFKHISKEGAFEKAEFIMGATPPAWKRVLTKKDKFVGAFMGGRIQLKKGDTVGALALGPFSGILIDVLTQVDLKFPDDISAEELEQAKKDLAKKRAALGI